MALYVGDHHNLPMDTRTLQGRWTLDPDGKNPVTGSFEASPGGEFLTSPLPDRARGNTVQIKVEVLKGSEWAGMDFYLPPLKE